MCMQHVTQALQNVSGVQVAAVDLTSGRALVKHDASAETNAMIEAVTEEGYTAEIPNSQGKADENGA